MVKMGKVHNGISDLEQIHQLIDMFNWKEVNCFCICKDGRVLFFCALEKRGIPHRQWVFKNKNIINLI